MSENNLDFQIYPYKKKKKKTHYAFNAKKSILLFQNPALFQVFYFL